MPMLPLALLAAGICFEQQTHARVGGQDAAPTTARVCVSGQRARLETGASGEALIVDLQANKALRLIPAAREAEALDLDRLRARARMDASLAADLMGAGGDARVRTRATGRSERLAGHECEAFSLSAGETRLEVCLTRELPVGLEAFAGLLELSGAEQSLQPLVAALRELQGFPLQTKSRVVARGVVYESVATVTRVEREPPAPALFEAPPGFTLTGGEEE